jgi:hypothetical protein
MHTPTQRLHLPGSNALEPAGIGVQIEPMG